MELLGWDIFTRGRKAITSFFFFSVLCFSPASYPSALTVLSCLRQFTVPIEILGMVSWTFCFTLPSLFLLQVSVFKLPIYLLMGQWVAKVMKTA